MITLAPTWLLFDAWLVRRPRVAAMAEVMVPALARFHGAVSLADVGEKSWLMWPAEQADIPPAMFAEHDLSRVTGVGVDSTHEIESRRLCGGPLVYTRAHQLTDAVPSRGHVVLQQLVGPVTRAPRLPWARDTAIESAPAVFARHSTPGRTFGRWAMFLLACCSKLCVRRHRLS